MEHIRLFKTQEEFLIEKPNLPYPCVSYVEETQNVEYEKQSIINAKYRITQDVIDECSNNGLTEIPLITMPQGSLVSYTINGETHVFEEPKYEILEEKEITYVETSIEGIGNCFGISKDSCTEGGKGLFNTAMTWTVDREISVDNDYICMSMTDGERYQSECIPLQYVGEEGAITFHSDNKSFSFIQDFCDEQNSSDLEGIFIGFSIVESSCVTVDEEEGIGLITSQPTTVTTFKVETLSNEDKLSPNIITVPCTQDDLDKEYDVKYILSKSAISIGKYSIENLDFYYIIPSPLYEIDLSKLDENREFSIDSNAFRYCEGLTEIVIPNSVTSIGDLAFKNCNGLTEINIPNSVTSIDYGAFFDCSGLSSITVSELNEIYDSRDNCNAIIETSTNKLVYGCTNTIIPSSVNSIGDFAFDSCSGLTEINIPDSVTSIGNYAFSYCSGLKSVTIGSGVTSIGGSAFRNCQFTEIKLPNSINYIGASAFTYCSRLTEIVIPNSVTSIGDWAFYECYSLTSVTIGNGVTSIGNYAFSHCYLLDTVILGSGVKSIGSYAFHLCDNISLIISYAINAPSITNRTFMLYHTPIGSIYGSLLYPKGSDYSSWLSENEFYLGFFNFNSQGIDVPTENITE